MKIDEKLMIDRWGNEVSYYREKALFLKRHMTEGGVITTTNEAEPLLIGAMYYFQPYQVAKEHVELMQKLREQVK